MQLPILLNRELLLANPHFQLVSDQRVVEGENLPNYYHLLIKEAVVALAWSSQGDLAVVREWRHPTGGWVLGLPGGGIDEGESSEAAAERELLEETGVVAKSWSPLGFIYPCSSMTGQRVYLWEGLDCKKEQPSNPEPTEFIQLLWLKPEEIAERIGQGERLDGILAAALWVSEMRRRGLSSSGRAL